MIKEQVFTFNPFSENTYVVFNEEKSAWIVDPGNSTSAETSMLENFIENNQLKVEKILLTHAHIDHILGLEWAFQRYQMPVHLHPKEEEILNLGKLSADMYGIHYLPFSGNVEFVEEGDRLTLGHEIFDIYFTPGHSPGSICYHHKDGKKVFSGDVLFQGSIGRTDLYKGDYDQLIESIHSKLFPLDEETVVFSGHGNPTRIGIEKKTNPFLVNL